MLTEFNFTTVVKDFNEAIEIYDENRRAPIPLIRNVLEGTIKGIIRKVGKKLKAMRKNLETLERYKILKPTPKNRQGENRLKKELKIIFEDNKYFRKILVIRL